MEQLSLTDQTQGLRLNERAFEAFEKAARKEIRAKLGRHDNCYGPKARVMVSTPGFWAEGPNQYVGISQWCCQRCAPIVAECMTDIIGGADVDDRAVQS